MNTQVSEKQPITAILVSPYEGGAFIVISTYTSIIQPYGESLNQELIDMTTNTIAEIANELTTFKNANNVIDIRIKAKGIGSEIYELIKNDFPNISKVFVTRSRDKI